MSHDRLSIVIPVYDEAALLPELMRRLHDALEATPDVRWQVLFVNDGSRDESLAILQAKHREDPRFGYLDLSRNFGHQAAISAGLAAVSADAVVVMDGDLQDPPELIPQLVEAWRLGAEVVVAERRSREDPGLRGLGFRFFHFAMRWISDFPIHTDSGVFGLLGSEALAALRQLPERNRFFPGLRSWVGFQSATVYYDRLGRVAGVPKQSFGRLVEYALDGVLSFSYKPLRMITLCGFAACCAGSALVVLFVGKRLLGIETADTGFTTLVTLTLVFGGAHLVAIGVVGEYLSRVYDEVKHRPLFIVRAQAGVDKDVESPWPRPREPRGTR